MKYTPRFICTFGSLFLYIGLIIMVLCTTLDASAQQVRVVQGDNYQPIEGVAVFNDRYSFSFVSNENGVIDLPDVLNLDSLHFQHPSYYEDVLSIESIAEDDYTVLLFTKIVDLPEFVISVSKIKERVDEITNKVSVISIDKINKTNPSTSADLLESTGDVYIQKSQTGGGSPIIRGFEANKVLIVVDGVRMNNAIYRGGHVQSVITLDPNMIERTEVVYGPGSLIYGSDALGGVMHFYSKDPALSSNEDWLHSLSLMGRNTSANGGRTVHADYSIGRKKLGSIISFTFNNFGNHRIGSNKYEDYPTWGQQPLYITTNEEGEDELVENEDQDLLIGSAYSQMDIMNKWVWKPKDGLTFRANFQYSTSSDIPRTDKLNDYSNDAQDSLKFAIWNYGPQNRILASLSTDWKPKRKLFDNVSAVAAFQRIDEDRIKRRFQEEAGTINSEDVYVYTANTDFFKQLNKKNSLQYGFEWTHNDVESSVESFTGGIPRLTDTSDDATRYPDRGSSMSTASAYVRHKWKIWDNLTLTDGLRFSYINLLAAFSEDFIDFPFQTSVNNYTALTGSAGLAYKMTPDTRLSFSVGTGFRAPNIDDTGKFFDFGDNGLQVPNFLVTPEYAINTEAAMLHRVSDRFTFEFDAFYTYIYDAIVRRAFTLNGDSTAIFQGDTLDVFANVNAGEAMIRGFSARFNVQASEAINFAASYNSTIGIDLTEDVPLGHIPPEFGRASFNYKKAKFDFEAYAKYNMWKRLKDYSPYSEDKADEATIEGTPGWATISARLSYSPVPSIQLVAEVENILDKHYVPFASGVSGTGRNLKLTLRTDFSSYQKDPFSFN